jgi:hypothetical protein
VACRFASRALSWPARSREPAAVLQDAAPAGYEAVTISNSQLGCGYDVQSERKAGQRFRYVINSGVDSVSKTNYREAVQATQEAK